jgi:hypothetical protein
VSKRVGEVSDRGGKVAELAACNIASEKVTLRSK